jgi:hypothetical protein
VFSIKQRGSVMIAFIVSLFYRHSCRTSLGEMRRLAG